MYFLKSSRNNASCTDSKVSPTLIHGLVKLLELGAYFESVLTVQYLGSHARQQCSHHTIGMLIISAFTLANKIKFEKFENVTILN